MSALCLLSFFSCKNEGNLEVEYSFATAKNVEHNTNDFREIKFSSDVNLDLCFHKEVVWIKLICRKQQSAKIFGCNLRKIFSNLGYTIENLDRVSFAGLTKKNLKRGCYWLLDSKEIGFLKMH